MIIKDFDTKYFDSRLIIDKRIFGLGAHISFIVPITTREIFFNIHIDLIFIRFWMSVYKIKLKIYRG